MVDGIEDRRAGEVAACASTGRLATGAVTTERREHYEGGQAEAKAKRTGSMAHGAHSSKIGKRDLDLRGAVQSRREHPRRVYREYPIRVRFIVPLDFSRWSY
jgi:hypothetical protein